MRILFDAITDGGVLGFLVRASAIFALAFLATVSAVRASAAWRAGVWRGAFGAVLALPLLSWMLPAATLGTSDALPIPSAVAPLFESAVTTGGPAPDALGPEPDAQASSRAKDGVARPAPTALALDLDLGLTATWAAGALLCILPTLLGALRARRVVRGAAPAPGERWSRALCAARARVGADIDVAVVVSDSDGAPFLWHPWPAARATIVVPPAGDREGDEWRAQVLAHELAHAVRRDGFVLLLARAVAAAAWMTPLSWLGLRRLRLETECAADDAVLRGGARASDYARGLLALVDRRHGGTALPLPAMGGARDLEARVGALLDPAADRRATSRVGATVLALASALCAVPLATLAGAEEARPLPIAIDRDTAVDQEAALGWGRGLQALVELSDESSGAWRGNVGYKLNRSWQVTAADVPHVGVTALAVEALLAGGQRPGEGPLGTALERGAAFLVASQREDGYVTAHGSRMRSHAHATRALARLVRVEAREEWRTALERAVEFLLAQQNSSGAWRFEPGAEDSDVVETSHQVEALRAARAAGFDVPDDVFARAADYARSTWDVDPSSRRFGAFRFQATEHARVNANTTAAGLSILAKRTLVQPEALQAALGFLDLLETERRLTARRDFGTHFLTWDTQLLRARALVRLGAVDGAPANLDLSAEATSRLERDREWLGEQATSEGHWVCSEGPGDAYATAVACLVLAAPH